MKKISIFFLVILLNACIPLAFILSSDPLSEQFDSELLDLDANVLLLTISYRRSGNGDSLFLSDEEVFEPNRQSALFEKRGGADVAGLAIVGGGFGGSAGVYGYILADSSGNIIYLGSCRDGQCFIKRKAMATSDWLAQLSALLGKPNGLLGKGAIFQWQLHNKLTKPQVVAAQSFISSIKSKYKSKKSVEWINISI